MQDNQTLHNSTPVNTIATGNTQPPTSNAVAQALGEKVTVTTILDPSIVTHDVTSIRNYLTSHRELCTRCQFVNISGDANSGFDTLFIGSTDPDYFTVFVFSYYMNFQVWKWSNGAWI